MRITSRICNMCDLKESDVVYLVSNDGKESEAFEVVTTFPGRLSAFVVVKNMATGTNTVMTPPKAGEYLYIIEEREDIAC